MIADTEAKIEAALLLDKKYWQNLKNGGARPLRKVPRWALQYDAAIYEKVRDENGLPTLGDARDMIGEELRKRLRETGHD